MASMSLSFEAVKRNVQDQVSGFSELPEPMGREYHRFPFPQLPNPREQV